MKRSIPRHVNLKTRVAHALGRTSCAMLLAAALQATGAENTASHQAVLELRPIGYWPADEGEGNTLHDRSANGYHGTIYSVPWRKGHLIFENDVYQWIQIPFTNEFGGKSFSMGGWIYSGFDDKRPRGKHNPGAVLIGQPFVWAARKSYQGMPELAGRDQALKWGTWGNRIDFTGTAVRVVPDSQGVVSLLEVAGGKANDLLDTVASQVALDALTWQHVLYTYEASGTGTLYLNGKRIKREESVPYEPADTPLVIGGGRWEVGGTTSLDGSLRNMVFFDRALDASDVARLCEVTRPDVKPDVIPFANLRGRQARETRSAEKVRIYSLKQLIEQVKNARLDETTRGEAALQLAEMGEDAKTAIPTLVDTLDKLTAEDGAHLPKIEEFFRNALIRALLDMDPRNAEAQAILTNTFAKPLFDALDTSKAYLAQIRPLLDADRYLQALAAYKAHLKSLPELPKRSGWGSQKIAEQLDDICDDLPLREEYFDRYLSRDMPFRDAQYYAYNLYDTRDGYFYTTVLERVPHEEVLRTFEKELVDNTSKRPEPEGKTALDQKLTREWTRVKLVKISPEGKRQYAYLHGDWFIFDARDAKMDGWSVVIDQKGYIHLLGGQHNSPNQDNYIPGSWERLGIAEGKNRPRNMYWVSKTPGDITDFEFVGQENNPRAIGGWMNYMNFSRSREGRLFLYGRGSMWTWAMLRYEEDSRRWVHIKGSHARMLERAKDEDPEWLAALGDTVPYYGPADGLAVAWQPAAYNYCRAWSGIIRGVTFDLDDRMHLQLQLFGVRDGGRVANVLMYAYSDDLGETFHRADGERLHLPLTMNPIPSHNADQTIEPTKRHFDLWQSLIIDLGCPK